MEKPQDLRHVYLFPRILQLVAEARKKCGAPQPEDLVTLILRVIEAAESNVFLQNRALAEALRVHADRHEIQSDDDDNAPDIDDPTGWGGVDPKDLPSFLA